MFSVKQRPLIVFCVSLRKNKPYVWISQEKLFVISAIQPNLGILQGLIKSCNKETAYKLLNALYETQPDLIIVFRNN